MAIIDKDGFIHGAVGTVVYRKVGSRKIVQSKPGKVKQTEATRESGLEFGLASSTARIIRKVMWPAYHTPDKSMPNRLTTRILKCINGSKTKGRGERDIHDGDLSYLTGFQFNKNSPLNEVLKVRPVLSTGTDGKPMITLPAFNSEADVVCPIKAYNGYTLRFMAVAFDFRSEYYEYLGCQDVWTYRGLDVPAQRWTIDKELPAGSFILFSVSLVAGSKKTFGETTQNTKEWDPCEIIGVMEVPQATVEITEPKDIAGATDGETDVQPVGETDRALKMRPMNSYFGKDFFVKITKMRENMSLKERRQMEERRQKMEELRRNLRQEQSSGTGMPVLPEGKVKF